MQLVTAANADAADECYAHHRERATPVVEYNSTAVNTNAVSNRG